ncbi:uncharacterized protein sc:d156 isoform X2 [Pimephales promelas]|uniref:uncharacterized protein sc:d156 isoform X2 n=1 Tax=Pimephales promelas TaxID=90988 RepID=UPI001955A436|nr:uncharacterized protein sc:d156 isoform X2 [Pimephales promelas]
MLQIIVGLLFLPGVLSEWNKEWNVKYPSSPICAVRGSNVTIACSFTYPPNAQVKQVLWCSMSSNHGSCMNVPYVYDSKANNNQRNFQYIGDKKSNCSLLISNITQTLSGEYKFRFITNLSSGTWTGDPGVEIAAHDSRVLMTRLRDTGSIIVGDSLNLTCTLDCSNLDKVQWFKDDEPMTHSDPILTFSSVTTKDSGNYSCSLRNFKTTVSEQYRIYIKEVAVSPTVPIIVVSSIALIGFIIAAVMLIRRKAETRGKPKEEEENHQAKTEAPTVTTNQEEAEDEVQYASVNIQPKEQLQMSANTWQKNDSSIYSTVVNG